jgi:transcription antitermination protein NusB
MMAPPKRDPAFASGRRRAREAALQVLFELDQTDHTLETALEDRLGREGLEEPFAEAAGPMTAPYEGFARRLASGAWQHREALDARIAAAAPQWPLAQLPAVERAILRLAIFELCFDNETPPRAAINEAVDLAKVYGGENSGRFVNGVLGSIASQVDRSGEVHGRVDL